MREAPAVASAPRLLHATDELHLVQVGNVHLSLYLTTPTVSLLDVDQRHHEALAKQVGGTVVLTVARHGLALPDDGARRRAAELVRHNATFVRRSASVIEGDGFWASAARSAVTAVFVFARQPYPSRVFGLVDEAAAWLQPDATASREAIHQAMMLASAPRRAA